MAFICQLDPNIGLLKSLQVGGGAQAWYRSWKIEVSKDTFRLHEERYSDSRSRQILQMGAPASEVKLSTPNLGGSRISRHAEVVCSEQQAPVQSICISAVKHRDGATGRTGRMVEGSGCFKVWHA